MADKPAMMTTTLWDFPSQQYGDEKQGDKNYHGATPSYVIWNLLQRYTRPNDLVVDPMCGSGTTLDVARDLDRRALGFDVNPTRPEILRADARQLPMEDAGVDFVFIDPPYSTHLEYSDDPRCIGKLSSQEPEYYRAMETVIAEMNRILRPGCHMALYVSDSFEKGKPFSPIGFELFARLRRFFEPVDIIAVTRRNRKLLLPQWHAAALEENFYHRGFNYLFIFRKPESKPVQTGITKPVSKPETPERGKWTPKQDYRKSTRTYGAHDKYPGKESKASGAGGSAVGKPWRKKDIPAASPSGEPVSEGGKEKPFSRMKPSSFEGGKEKPFSRMKPSSFEGGKEKPFSRAKPSGFEGGKEKPFNRAKPSSFEGGKEKPFSRAKPSGFEGGKEKPFSRAKPSGFEGGKEKPFIGAKSAEAKGGYDKPHSQGKATGFGGEKRVMTDDASDRMKKKEVRENNSPAPKFYESAFKTKRRKKH